MCPATSPACSRERSSERRKESEATRQCASPPRSFDTSRHSRMERSDLRGDEPVDPGRVLVALLPRLPDGRPQSIERPLTPLLDTTVFTNAPGEPAVGHELRAEVPSADAIDVVMAFVRWSGVRPLIDALRRHCEEGKPLRVLTTTYTNSTEQRALDELERLGAQIKVSYDTSSTRLHAKAWIFHRESGYSTAYIGSSNLTHSAQVLGLEWNVRVSARAQSGCGREDGGGLHELLGEQGLRALRPGGVQTPHSGRSQHDDVTLLSPIELELRPFQEALLEHVALARHQGHHRNLLVAATGTGKTVMAAVDYARLRSELARSTTAVRRSPRGDPRPEPGHVPARAARCGLRREVGRRPAARAVRARLRVDPEPPQRRRPEHRPDALRRRDRGRVPPCRGAVVRGAARPRRAGRAAWADRDT